MIPNQFDYATPTSLDEAVNLLADHGGAMVLAGGFNLIMDMKQKRVSPTFLVDLRKIPELQGISRHKNDNGLQIGAMATFREVSSHPTLQTKYAALVEAIDATQDMQIRNVSTITDGLQTHRSDLSAALMALNATVNIKGHRQERTIPLDEYFIDSLQTSLGEDEVITSIDLPATTDRTSSAYEKFEYPADGTAVCGVAVAIEQTTRHTVKHCSIAVVGDTSGQVTRLNSIENALKNKKLTAEDIVSAVDQFSDNLEFSSDLYASGEYKAHTTKVLVRRALTRAAKIQ